MSKQWDTLDTNTKQYIALTSSGANQIQNFYALMSNFETAVNASTTAIQSQGSAWRENSRYMESIEAKVQKVKTALEDMILGDGGLEKLIKTILDISTKTIKLIDDIGGLKTVIIALTSALILLNGNGLQKVFSSISTLIPMLQTATVKYTAFGIGVTTANEAMTVSVPVIGLIVVALTGLIAVLTYVANSTDRTIDRIQELNTKIESEDNEIQQITKNIETLKNRLEELNSVDNPKFVDQQEINNLTFTIHQLERELALKREIAEQDKKEREEKALKVVTNRNSYTGAEHTLMKGGEYWSNVMGDESTNYEYELEGKEYYQQVKAYTERINALKEQSNALVELNKNLDENSKEYENNQKKIEQADELIQSYNSMLIDMVSELQSATEGLDSNSVAYLLAQEAINAYSDSILKYQSAEEKAKTEQDVMNFALENAREQYQLTEEQYKELQEVVQEAIDNKDDEEEAYSVATKAIEEYVSSLEKGEQTNSNWSKQMDNLQSAYATLTTAVDEYNKTGQFSLDTVQDLLALSPEYLSMLQFENGQVRLNEEAIKKKALSLIDEAKAQVYKTAEQKLASLADKESSSSLDDNSQSLADNTTELLKNSKALYDNAYTRAFQNGDQKEARKIYDETAQQIKTLDDLAKNLGTSFKKTFTDSKTATKQATEAVKENKEAVNALKASVEALKQEVSDMEDELDKYKKAISYINDKIDEEIDRLKELRDNETDAIEEKINLLEDEKRITEDTAKENIKKLEEERDAIVNSTKEQVEALQEKKSLEEEYWNKKIQALKDQNEALDDQAQLEQLLLNLEKAKNTKVRVYKEGQGFVWETDKQAVDKAQKELDKYYRKQEYEEQLRELEDFKKRSLDNYSEQIKNLNDYSNKVKNNYNAQIDSINSALAQKKTTYDKEISALKTLSNNIKKEYDTQIKYYEDYKKRFEKQLKAYETEQSRLLTLQLTGIDFENDNWKTRLGNLDAFAKEYNEKLKALNKKQEELNKKQKELNNLQSQSSTTTSDGGQTPSTSPSTNPNPNPTNNNNDTGQLWKAGDKTFPTQSEARVYSDSLSKKKNELLNQINAKQNQINNSSGQFRTQLQKELDNLRTQYGAIDTSVVRIYGSGTPYVRDDQVAIVGDNPNSRELVIGSKLNGMAMNLKKGTGVVNAQATNTLAGMFNALGSGSASKGNFSLSDIKEKGSQSIVNIGDISLPQVRDATDFINALGNFENIMAQRAYSAI